VVEVVGFPGPRKLALWVSRSSTFWMAMLPTLLEGGSHQKPLGSGMVEGAIRPPAGKTEMAGLQAFLKSRCGNLKSAFYALDVHSVGQVTSDDFVKGLQRLGYSEDATAIFHAIDSTSSGLVSLKNFLRNVGGQSGEEEEVGSHLLRSSFNSVGDIPSRSSHRASSADAWRSARIPRYSSDSQLGRTSSPKHRGSVSLTDLDACSPKSHACDRPPAPPAVPPAVATAELQARISWVEEQCSAEQKQRAEMENRLTQHLNTLVGISISEQLDALRQQLIEERMQRQVDVTSVRANLESIRSEVGKGGRDIELSLKTSEVADSNTKLGMRLEEVAAELRARLDTLEVPADVTRHCARDATSEASGSPESTVVGNLSLQQDVCRLQRQTASLEEQLGGLEQRFESFQGAGSAELERTLALVDERLEAQRAVLLQEAGNGPSCSLSQVETHVREKLDGLRLEWGAVIEKSSSRHEEDTGSVMSEVLSQVRGYMTERLDGMRSEWKAMIEEDSERVQVLGRTLGKEFERSITSQAIAEARAEACSAVSSMLDVWRKDNELQSHSAPELLAAEMQEFMKVQQHLQSEVASLFTLLKTGEEQRNDNQNSMALLRGDIDGLRTKLQDRMPSRLDEVTDRVASLEAAFQHVGATAQEVETMVTKKVEQLSSDRFAVVDAGLSRVSTEVKQQGDGLQQLQRRQQVFSEEFLRRLQALVDKLDVQGLEHIGSALKDIERSGSRSPTAGVAKKRLSCPAGRPLAARSASQKDLPEVQIEVAMRALSRDRSPCRSPEDDSARRGLNAGAAGTPCAACGTPSAPAPAMTPSAPVPLGSPATTHRSVNSGPVQGVRQVAAGAPRIPPQGSPTLRSRQVMVVPPHSVASNQRMVSMPQSPLRCRSPAAGSSVGNGATRLASTPGKP